MTEPRRRFRRRQKTQSFQRDGEPASTIGAAASDAVPERSPQPDEAKSDNRKSKPMMQKLKIAAIALLALFVLIVVLQNTESVETKILFFSITMPRAALLFGALVVGFIVGVFTVGKILTRGQKKADEKEEDR